MQGPSRLGADDCRRDGLLLLGFSVVLMPSPRRFPPPWTVEELDACFVAEDRRECWARLLLVLTT